MNMHKGTEPGKMQVGAKRLWIIVCVSPAKLMLDKIFSQMKSGYVTHKVVYHLFLLVRPIFSEVYISHSL